MKNFKLEPKERNLSDVPSKAIRQCLDDLEVCEKNPNYRIKMDYWHGSERLFVRTGTSPCPVCLGGSRLARIVDDPFIQVNPISAEGVSPEEAEKIMAMECFRCGNVLKGLYRFFDLIDLYHETLTTDADFWALLFRNPKSPEVRELKKVRDWPGGLMKSYDSSPELFKNWIKTMESKLEKAGV